MIKPKPKKLVVKPRPQKRLTEEQIDIATRLAAAIDCTEPMHAASLLLHVAQQFGNAPKTVTHEYLLMRGSWTIKTLQLNNDAGHQSFQAHCTYEDRDAEPLYGAVYPTKYAIICKPSLADAVIIAYLTVCKQLGRYF